MCSVFKALSYAKTNSAEFHHQNLVQLRTRLEMPIVFSEVIDRLWYLAFQQHGIDRDLEGVFEFVETNSSTFFSVDFLSYHCPTLKTNTAIYGIQRCFLGIW